MCPQDPQEVLNGTQASRHVIPGDTGPGGPHAASQAGQFAFSDKTCKVKVSQGKTVLQWGPVRHLPRDLASRMRMYFYSCFYTRGNGGSLVGWSVPRLTFSDLRTPVTVIHHLANTLRNLKKYFVIFDGIR